MKPNAKIAQGFDSYIFVMESGKILTGFVTGESADEVQLRQNNGLPARLRKDQIEVRKKTKGSMMPEGLEQSLKPGDFADLLEFLRRGPVR